MSKIKLPDLPIHPEPHSYQWSLLEAESIQAYARAAVELNKLEKEWVGLTDDEIRELEKHFEAQRIHTSGEEYLLIYPFAYWKWQRAIETKLKEKNT